MLDHGADIFAKDINGYDVTDRIKRDGTIKPPERDAFYELLLRALPQKKSMAAHAPEYPDTPGAKPEIDWKPAQAQKKPQP